MNADRTNADKETLRAFAKASIARLTPQQLDTDAHMISVRLRSMELYTHASTVMIYAATPDELSVDAFALAALADNKRVCVPRVHWDEHTMTPARIQNLDTDLAEDRYMIRVPSPQCPDVNPSEIDLAIIPALAYDTKARRLGRGAGFYDRWIEHRRASKDPCVFVGVCVDQQLVERVPTDTHDQPMDLVVTPTLTIPSPDPSPERNQAR